MPPLERFRQAQNQSHEGFADALAELRSGAKRGHWIWYVFPQLAGLGTSAMSLRFAIDDPDDSSAYLSDPELRTRLIAATNAVADQLRSGIDLTTLMGSTIDARKVISCLTLFEGVCRQLRQDANNEELLSFAAAADEIISICEPQGYPRCPFTLARLHGWQPRE